MAKIGLPGISSKLPPDVRQFLERTREFINSGNFVTREELLNAGIATDGGSGGLLPGGKEENDRSIPPAPTGLRADGAMTNIILQWDDPKYKSLSYAEIFRAGKALPEDPDPSIGDAIHVAVATGTLYADPVAPDSKYWYWVRFWSKAGVVGPWSGTAGVNGQTSRDPAYLLEVLNGQITESQLYGDLNTRIRLVSDSAYSTQSLSEAMLEVLAEDDVKRSTIRTKAHSLAAAEEKITIIETEAGATASSVTTLAARTDENLAVIQRELTATTSKAGATASSVDTLQTTVGGHTTSIQTQGASIDGVRASYMVKIDNNGHMSGYGISSELIEGGAAVSKFIASVDQFAVVAPGRAYGALNSVPFAVLTTAQTINGVYFAPGVYIDGGSIVKSTIGKAQIGTAVIDDAHIASLNAVKIIYGTMSGERIEVNTLNANRIDTTTLISKLAIIEAAYITNANIKGAIQSNDYSPGAAGWKIDKGGAAEFNNIYARGNIQADSLNAATGTFTGELSAATGTFAGSLTAASGTFSGAVNVGAFTAYAWPTNGGTGAHLSTEGFLIGNVIASAGNPHGRYFQIHLPAGGTPSISTNIPAYLEDLQVKTAQIDNLCVNGNKITGVSYSTVYVAAGGTQLIGTVAGRIPLVVLYPPQDTGYGSAYSGHVVPAVGSFTIVNTSTLTTTQGEYTYIEPLAATFGYCLL